MHVLCDFVEASMCSFHTTVILHCDSVKFTANPNTLSYILMSAMSQISNVVVFYNFHIVDYRVYILIHKFSFIL
jgi:hypothetical protein